MKPGVATGIHWRPRKSIFKLAKSENITYLHKDRYVLDHVTSLNGFYLSRFKTPFLNLPVLYIPWYFFFFQIEAKNSIFQMIFVLNQPRKKEYYEYLKRRQRY